MVARLYLKQVLSGAPLNMAKLRRDAAKPLGGRNLHAITITKYVDEYWSDVKTKLDIELRRE